ncbi:MAG: hypothetical protein QX198_03950 [Methylococcaceae bacterium]
MKHLLMSLLTGSLLLTGCSSLQESGMDGCTSQSKPRSDDLAEKKETTEMKGEVVVLYACLPHRELSENEIALRIASCVWFVHQMATNSCGPETARFSVKEALLGSYEGSFVEVTGIRGESLAPLWQSGEYVLFFKKPKCKEIRIVQFSPCDDGYVDAGKPNPDGSATVCVGKVCYLHQYSETLSSKVLRDADGTPFIVDPRPVEYFKKQWGLQIEPFESKGYWWKRSPVSKGIRLDTLRKCLEAGRCVP